MARLTVDHFDVDSQKHEFSLRGEFKRGFGLMNRYLLDTCGNIWCSVHGVVKEGECKPCPNSNCDVEVKTARDIHTRETSYKYLYLRFYFPSLTGE